MTYFILLLESMTYLVSTELDIYFIAFGAPKTALKASAENAMADEAKS